MPDREQMLRWALDNPQPPDSFNIDAFKGVCPPLPPGEDETCTHTPTCPTEREPSDACITAEAGDHAED